MCGRPLDVDADPLSGDCGGDCWGCVGWVEAEMFGAEDNPSVEMIRKEIEWGWREADGKPKSPERILAGPTSKDST
jgi:hypothetical protein